MSYRLGLSFLGGSFIYFGCWFCLPLWRMRLRELPQALSAILEPVEVSEFCCRTLGANKRGWAQRYASARHWCRSETPPASDFCGFQQQRGQDWGDAGLMVLVPGRPENAPSVLLPGLQRSNRCILSRCGPPFEAVAPLVCVLFLCSHSKPGVVYSLPFFLSFSFPCEALILFSVCFSD